MRLQLGGIATAIALTGSNAASAPVHQVTIPASAFEAHWNDRIRTSGGELLGLITGAPSAMIREPDVTVGGIGESDSTVCVTIRQVSGAYVAHFVYHNVKGDRTVSFALPREKIKSTGLAVGEMAILARASSGDQCSNRDPVLPAAWTGTATGTMLALVNDHQADRSRTVRPVRAGDCQPLDRALPGRSLTVYQVACPVPQPVGSCAPVSLAIQLDNGGEVAFVEAAVRGTCP